MLETGLSDYLEAHRLPAHQQRAICDLLRCRTAALGGHAEVCPEGHHTRVWYNSCRHRSCPQCSYLQIQEWLEGKKRQILPCDHYHVVFTLPAELRLLWQWNPRALAGALFQSACDTLFKLLADDRHLGARPGVIAALHTWGRTLVLHPHVHCLVTGGGLTPQGAWKSVRHGFLLPLAVVRVIYRGKLLSAVEQLLRRGALRLPPDLDLAAALALLRKAARKKWNVCIRERYPHGRGVATYLARYMRGGPIKNHRLVAHDRDSVTFRYAAHRQSGEHGGRPPQRTMTLPMAEFLHRFLQHVPAPGQHVVRLYGLYSRTGGDALAACRAQLVADDLLAGIAVALDRLEHPAWGSPSPTCVPSAAGPSCSARPFLARPLPRRLDLRNRTHLPADAPPL